MQEQQGKKDIYHVTLKMKRAGASNCFIPAPTAACVAFTLLIKAIIRGKKDFMYDARTSYKC
jgi:hypothetical protein